jgi:hypothetical protein
MTRRALATLLALLGLQVHAEDRATAKADCEAVMNVALPFAEEMLQKHGEFFPFGATMNAKGEISHVGGYDGREHPPSADIIKLLKDGFRAGAKNGELKATALVYDVRVILPGSGEKSDAVAVSLNHRANYSVVVLFPYRIDGGKVVFGETFAQEGEADIFASK